MVDRTRRKKPETIKPETRNLFGHSEAPAFLSHLSMFFSRLLFRKGGELWRSRKSGGCRGGDEASARCLQNAVARKVDWLSVIRYLFLAIPLLQRVFPEWLFFWQSGRQHSPPFHVCFPPILGCAEHSADNDARDANRSLPELPLFPGRGGIPPAADTESGISIGLFRREAGERQGAAQGFVVQEFRTVPRPPAHCADGENPVRSFYGDVEEGAGENALRRRAHHRYGDM